MFQPEKPKIEDLTNLAYYALLEDIILCIYVTCISNNVAQPSNDYKQA